MEYITATNVVLGLVGLGLVAAAGFWYFGVTD
jgi:hypothetical protein